MSLPEITSESKLEPFKIYQDGKIYQAILHRFTIFRLLDSFDARHRTEAYALACRLTHQGYPTVVSAKSDGAESTYRVWADIRYPVPASTTSF